jgi:hypothetical protein
MLYYIILFSEIDTAFMTSDYPFRIVKLFLSNSQLNFDRFQQLK